MTESSPADEERDDAAAATVAEILAPFPHPAFLIDRHGVVIGCNDASHTTFQNAIPQPLAQAIGDLASHVRLHGTAVEHTVDYAQEDMGGESYQVVVMPAPAGDTEQNLVALVLNRTLETAMRAALVDSRSRFKDLVDLVEGFAWEVDKKGVFTFFSVSRPLGHDSQGLIGQSFRSLVHPDLNPSALTPFETHNALRGEPLWLVRADGTPVFCQLSAVPLLSASGAWRGARGLCRDMSEEIDRDKAYARVLNRERTLARIIRVFHGITDPDKVLEVAAATICAGLTADACQIFLLGERRSKVEPQPPLEMAASAGRPPAHATVHRALDRLATVDELVRIDEDGWIGVATLTGIGAACNGAVCLWRQADGLRFEADEELLFITIAEQVGAASERLTQHERLVKVSQSDPLTDLLNRKGFEDELRRRLSRLEGEGALIYIDLDNFKKVNDRLGHQKGDEVLLTLRDILVHNTRTTDLVARMGGDEFVVWLDGADQRVAKARAEAFLGAAQALGKGLPKDIVVSISIGVAMASDDHKPTLDELIQKADHAMLRVKAAGKAAVAFAGTQPPKAS